MRHVVAAVIGVVCCAVFVVSVAGAVPWSAPSVEDVERALDGLGFDAFVETSYRLYVLRHPEWVTSLGIADEFGIRNDALNDYAHAYVLETQAIETLIFERLETFDPSDLTGAQRETYEIASWFWDDLVRGQAYADYRHPIHFLLVRSLHGYLEMALTEDHPFGCEADVEDYLTRLGRVGRQVDQMIAELERREDLGIVVPRTPLEWAIGHLREMRTTYTPRHPFYLTLKTKGAGVAGLSADALDAYLEDAATAIDDVVKPAYGRLHDAVVELRRDAPTALSIGQYDGGADAYAYLLRHHTGTDLTPSEIHALGLREVERVQAEIRVAAAALGVDPSSTIAEIFAVAAAEGGIVRGQEGVREAEALIEKAEAIVLDTGALTALPEGGVVVLGAENGGFYSPGALDGSRPGAYYATTGGPVERFVTATVAFHEAVPGHHVQLTFARELDLPLLRKDVVFTGFAEGWALYAERLMGELGAYDDDPWGNLGRLKFELVRAVRLVADTGIHHLGWSFDEAADYIAETTGDSRGTADYRALRYTVIPGQATAYMIGLLEILDLRETAREALGEAFDLARFHDVVLGSGNLPLGQLRGLVEAWIAEANHGA